MSKNIYTFIGIGAITGKGFISKDTISLEVCKEVEEMVKEHDIKVLGGYKGSDSMLYIEQVSMIKGNEMALPQLAELFPHEESFLQAEVVGQQNIRGTLTEILHQRLNKLELNEGFTLLIKGKQTHDVLIKNAKLMYAENINKKDGQDEL